MSRGLVSDCRVLLNSASRLLDQVLVAEGHLLSAKLFRISLFSWVLLHTLLLVPYHEQVWSPEAYILSREFNPDRLFDWLVRISVHPSLGDYYLLFVAGQVLCLVLGILGTGLRVVTPLIYVLTMNVDARAPVLMDGGNNLSHLLLFYIIFMNTSGRPVTFANYPILRMLTVGSSNASVYMCRLQIIALYLTASLLKVQGALWQKGMTLYYLLQSITYSHPLMAAFVTAFPFLTMFGTYFAVIFQLVFPALIWFRAARPWLLIAGVFLHLGISFAMGLFTFGLVMIMCYPIFFYEDWSRRFLEWLAPSNPVLVLNPQENRLAHAFMRMVDFLDWRRLVRVTSSLPSASFSRELYHEEGSERLRTTPHLQCWYVGREDHVYTGFGAYAEILGRLPLFVPLIPALRIIDYIGFGNLLAGALRGPARVQAVRESAA